MEALQPTVWQVFWAALATDLATGLGALPFFFFRTLSPRWQGFSYRGRRGDDLPGRCGDDSEQPWKTAPRTSPAGA